MKCPKCNYISFDYNQVCPKCNKNISSEQQRMNLPDYKPSPPYLLGSLLGETGRSEEAIFSEGRNFDFGLELEESDVTIAAADLTEEDLSNKAEEEIENLEPLSGLEFEEDGGEKTRGPESLLQRDPDLTVALPGDDEGEEPTVNLDDFSYSHDGPDKEAIMDGTLDEEELGIDLEDLALDEIASSNRGPEKAGNLDDAEKVTLVIDTKGEKSSKGIEETELELELEKIDDK